MAKSSKTKSTIGQISLFDNDIDFLTELAGKDDWPNPKEFPFNQRKVSVGSIIDSDLKNSSNPLIITGYASLERLITYCSKIRPQNNTIRILLGSEPYDTNRSDFSVNTNLFSDEVRDYWLERSISILLSAQVIQIIEHIRSGKIQFRYINSPNNKLHAKIYVSDEAVTIGSSNFSNNGLQKQLEANVRFKKNEKRRYENACKLANNYWEMGDDYNEDLINLLEQLLQVVSWQEALARACAEVLEGDWAKRYLEIQMLPGDLPLWPSQKQGIAQALWLLETVGSVLVADATGAGKTRMGAYLVRATVDRIWSTGRVRKGESFLVCPPAVVDVWQHESIACQLPININSQGALSRQSSQRGEDILDGVRRAQILAVDEAHNYLNVGSHRTQMLLGNIADHVLLFTATPINKGPKDLLRLADMLGADNLEDETILMFEKILRMKRGSAQRLSETEVIQLRRQIQQFTVRRTKSMLNELVDREPQRYKSKSGDLCRYPEHESLTYQLFETETDCKLAEKISEIANSLKGLAYLKSKIEMPKSLKNEGWDEQKYLDSRLLSSKRLARYVVMSCMRSSRAALLEHIEGTEFALKFEELSTNAKKNHTGNQIEKLDILKGNPPGHVLDVTAPIWLTDKNEHLIECSLEIKRYHEISRCIQKMSPSRENAKTKHLAKMAEAHLLSIAFDSKPLTLAVIKKYLLMQNSNIEAILATGENKRERIKIKKLFDHSSKAKGIVALCSDSMSEGINLQQASVVTHLDMPSVVRVAEQRVGRVDRMDSPHKKIQAWWPDDAEPFCLSTDDRFVERLETVDVLIGSNMPLPDSISSNKIKISAKDAIKEQEKLEQSEKSWDELLDALQPVRELVYGHHSIIDKKMYDFYRHEKARVLSRVSLLKSNKSWAFFCIAGSLLGAPRWVFFSNDQPEPILRLNEIALQLKKVLQDDISSLKIDASATSELDKYLDKLLESEKKLLPRRKQRALDEMTKVLKAYCEESSKNQYQQAFEFYHNLIDVLEMKDRRHIPDWGVIADKWLDLIRPVWYKRLTERRVRPLLLKDIRKNLLEKDKLSFEEIFKQFSSLPKAIPIDKRVVSVILGIAS